MRRTVCLEGTRMSGHERRVNTYNMHEPGLQISKYSKSIHHDRFESMNCVVVGRDVSLAGPH